MTRTYVIEIESGVRNGLFGVERAFDNIKNSLHSDKGSGIIESFTAAQKVLEEVKPSTSPNKQSLQLLSELNQFVLESSLSDFYKISIVYNEKVKPVLAQQ